MLLSEGLLQFSLLEQRVGRRPVCCWVGGEGFFQGWELGAGGAAEEEAANGSAGTGPVAMAVLGICGFPCPLPASPVAHTTQRQRKAAWGRLTGETCPACEWLPSPTPAGAPGAPREVLQVEYWGEETLGCLFPGHQGTLGFQSEGYVSWLS